MFIFKILKVNIIILIFIVVVIEILGRSYVALSDDRDFFRKKLFVSPWFTTLDSPAPEFHFLKNKLYGKFKHKNKLIAVEKGKNEIRIVVLGGSTTKNQTAYKLTGIDYAKSLEMRLQLNYPDKVINILNAGSEAYSSAHSLVNLSLRVISFNPDLIIVMHAANDYSAAFIGNDTAPDYTNKYMHPTYLSPEAQRFRGIYGYLVQSRVLSHLGIAKIFGGRSLDYSKNIDSALMYFIRNMENISSVATASNIEVLFLTQPHDSRQQEEGSKKAHRRFNSAILKLESVAKSESHVFDLALYFGEDEKYFVDSIHYTSLGIKHFTKLIEPTVSNILKKNNL